MTERVLLARVSAAELNLDDCIALTSSPTAGAVVTFCGIVRDHDGGRSVSRLSYEAHPAAELRLAEVAEAVAAKHPEAVIAVAHRVGDLEVGDLALAAAVASPHRAAAFAACAELIEEIKLQVPIWKQQHFTDGSTEWVGSLGA